MLFAARLALQEWNAKGGVGGYRIELVAQDDRNEPEMGALQARKMALDPAIVGVVGHPSSESALAAPVVYHQAGLPVVVTGASAQGLTSAGYQEVFRLGPTDDQLAQTAASFTHEELAARRVAVVSGPGPSDQALGQGFAAAARKLGMEADTLALEPEQADMGPTVAELRRTSPDVVLYAGDYVQGGALLAEMRRQDLDVPLLGGPGLASPDLLKIAGPAAEGVYYLSPGPSPSDIPAAAAFVQGFQTLSGTVPRSPSLLVYEAANLMLEVLRSQAEASPPPSRAALVEGLRRARYQGLTGEIAFDELGNRLNARAYLYRVEGMAWPGRLLRQGPAR
jgi:ABC-type branched-subunit amino acid transport system substrate-binding protein